MPRLTVILPVKNGAPHIRSAVRSTIGALPSDSELVVLDDNSTDNTRCVLDEFTDQRLKVLDRSDGAGLPGALNELLARTDSQYVARMDADDVVLPWRFKRQLASFRQGLDFCFGTVVHWNGSLLGTRPTRVDRIDGSVMNMLLLLENPVAHSTAMFDRRSIDRLGGYSDVLSEDYELWMRAASHGYRIRRIATPILVYRHHPAQVTQDGEWKRTSRVEQPLVRSHSALADKLLGISGDRLSGIRGLNPTAEQTEMSMEMLDSIEARLDRMPEGRGSVRLKRTSASIRRRLAGLE